MKILSSLLAILVFALATLPCCLEDDCICASTPELYGGCKCGCAADGDDCECEHDADDDAALPLGCCSPFVNCNTCTGVTAAHSFSIPGMVSFRITEIPSSFGNRKIVRGFAGSVWRPPIDC